MPRRLNSGRIKFGPARKINPTMNFDYETSVKSGMEN